jgi:hypothetical protein
MIKRYLDESTIRGRAKRRGYRLHRAPWSRGYALIDRNTNSIVLGHQFNAELEEIVLFLAKDKRPAVGGMH